MPTVYSAHDLKNRRKVALKTLNPELAGVLGVERCARAIKATASCMRAHHAD